MNFRLIFWLLVGYFGKNFATECYRENHSATCRNVTFPIPPLPHLQELLIINSTIPQPPPNFLAAFGEIIRLSLRNVSVVELAPGVFNDLGNLQELDLSFNRITAIPEGVFEELTHLKVLRLARNKISSIDKGSFRGLSRLEELFLDHNDINRLDESLFSGLISLRTLDVSNNPMRKFPRVSLTLLKYFYASNINLESFDTELINPNPLWSVNVSRNWLKEVDFEHLRTNVLDLSDNNISTVKNWHQLTSKFLFLSGNNITNLGSMPKTITYLFLRYNNIKNLGNAFSDRKDIKNLDLGFNRIQNITSETFLGLEDLNTLYLLHNNITILHADIFQKCSKLKYLDLSQNRIETIEVGAFNGMESLTRLNVSNNHLKTLDFYVFGNLKKLIDLSFSYNKIVRINIENFEKCTSGLKFVQLNQNPWNCDNLREVLENLKNRNVKVNDIRSFYGYSIEGISCKLYN